MTKRRALLTALLRAKLEEPATPRVTETSSKPQRQMPKTRQVEKQVRRRSTKNTPEFDYLSALRGDSLNQSELPESAKRNVDILRKRAFGSTLDEIGQEYGITREAVRQIVVRCGGAGFKEFAKEVKAQQLGELESQNDVIRSYVRTHPGLTLSELAAEFDLPESVAQSRLTKLEKKLISGSRLVRDKTRFWTDEMILDALRLAQTYHYPLTTNDYQELVTIGEIKGPSVPLIANRFKTWKQACIAAGVEYVESHATYSVTWSRDDLVEILGQYLLDPETTGTIGDYNRWREEATDRIPSLAQMRIVVGPWSESCDEALSNIRSNSWDRPNDV